MGRNDWLQKFYSLQTWQIQQDLSLLWFTAVTNKIKENKVIRQTCIVDEIIEIFFAFIEFFCKFSHRIKIFEINLHCSNLNTSLKFILDFIVIITDITYLMVAAFFNNFIFNFVWFLQIPRCDDNTSSSLGKIHRQQSSHPAVSTWIFQHWTRQLIELSSSVKY